MANTQDARVAQGDIDRMGQGASIVVRPGESSKGKELAGVRGIEDVSDATLIRHAYVRTAAKNQGVGGRMLAKLRSHTMRPTLVGTWAAAEWAGMKRAGTP